jgi:hypothetical protein
MATRLSRWLRVAAVALAALLLTAACTNPDRPSVQADEVALPTPLRSIGPSTEAAIGQLDAALNAAGSRLVDALVGYRPSEPPPLIQVPRAVRRADLADPDDGYIVIYEAGSPGAAQERARELADHLESGFGQTNFTPDTQFSVAVLGDSVIFTSWSRGGSSDPERAEAAFDAITTVGQAVEVDK